MWLLKAADNSDIDGRVFPVDPVGEKHVNRPGIAPWQESLLLPHWAEARLDSSLEEGVSEVMVTHDAFSLAATGNGMVTMAV